MKGDIKELENKNVKIWVRKLNNKIHSVAILPKDPLHSPIFLDGGNFKNRFLQDVATDIKLIYSLSNKQTKILTNDIFNTKQKEKI